MGNAEGLDRQRASVHDVLQPTRSLEDVLQKKYHMHPLDAKDLSSLLLPMLRLAPEERRTAQDLLSHPWLRGLPGPEVSAAVARVGPQPPLTSPSENHLRSDGKTRRDRGDEARKLDAEER